MSPERVGSPPPAAMRLAVGAEPQGVHAIDERRGRRLAAERPLQDPARGGVHAGGRTVRGGGREDGIGAGHEGGRRRRPAARQVLDGQAGSDGPHAQRSVTQHGGNGLRICGEAHGQGLKLPGRRGIPGRGRICRRLVLRVLGLRRGRVGRGDVALVPGLRRRVILGFDLGILEMNFPGLERRHRHALRRGCGRELILCVLLRLLERGIGLAIGRPGNPVRDRGQDFLRRLLRVGRPLQRILFFDQVLPDGRDGVIRLLEQFIQRLVLGLDACRLLFLERHLEPFRRDDPIQCGQACIELDVAPQLDEGLPGRQVPDLDNSVGTPRGEPRAVAR